MTDPDKKHSSGQVWVIDPNHNLKEALGFLKDWVTTFLTLQTSIIAALAALVGVKGADDFAKLSCLQIAPLGIAGLSSLISIITGLYLLNMIPAAAQRKAEPYDPAEDLFSIKTQSDGQTIKFLADWFRFSFLAAIIALMAFVFLKLARIS